MANALYDNYKNLILGNDSAAHTFPDMDTDNIKAILVDHGVTTPSPTTHQDHADLSGAVVTGGTSGNMSTPAFPAAGAIDYAVFSFTTVSGASVESINFYKDSGVSSTSALIIYIDTATGLPLTPNGGDVNVAFNASGLYGF